MADIKLPAGWKLVPEEPTEAMLDALGATPWIVESDTKVVGHEVITTRRESRDQRYVVDGWEAMLKAAPPPPFTAKEIVSLNMIEALRVQHLRDEAQRVCQHAWPHAGKPMPASWYCACGTKVYRSREDAIDD